MSDKSEVLLGEQALRSALEKLGREAIFLSGNTEALNLNLGSLVFCPAPPVDIKLQYSGDVPDLPIKDDGEINSLSFDIKAATRTQSCY